MAAIEQTQSWFTSFILLFFSVCGPEEASVVGGEEQGEVSEVQAEVVTEPVAYEPVARDSAAKAVDARLAGGWARVGLLIDESAPKPRFEYGEPEIHGACDRAEMDEVLNKKQAAFKYCYEKGLQKDHGLEGSLVVAWVLRPNRDLVASVVASTLDDSRTEYCVLRVARRMKFRFAAQQRCVYGRKLVFYPKPET